MNENPTYSYRLAHLDDAQAIVDVHYACFTKETNIPMYFGRDFIEQIDKWLITSPLCFTMVAEHEGEIVAFESACDGPYYGPMMLHNWQTVLRTVLKRPLVLLDKPVRDRLLGIPKKLIQRLKGEAPPDPFMGVRPASLVYMGVHPDHRAGFEVASQLLLKVREEGCRRGWQKVYAGVHKGNVTVLFLYKMHKFRPIPELETEYLTFVVQDL